MMIRWRRMGRARITLICMGRVTKYILIKKSEGRKPFWRPTHRAEDNIKLDLKAFVDGIDLAEDMDQWRTYANASELNERWEISWIVERLLACRQGFCSMKICCARVLKSHYPIHDLLHLFTEDMFQVCPTWVALILDEVNCSYKMHSPMASILSEEFESSRFVAFHTKC
jgi:hypothetical protein